MLPCVSLRLAPAGQNGPVVAFLFGGPPIEEQFNGILAEDTITEADLVGPLEGQPFGALLDAIEAGNTYVNVHTTANPGGEIRGQIAVAGPRQ